jgi:hypothetical protein
MKKSLIALCLLMIAGTESATAQAPAQTLPPPDRPPSDRPPSDAAPTSPLSREDSAGQSSPFNLLDGPVGATRRVWFQAEYMMWWLKNAPPPFPFVTTGDPANDPTAGALGSPSTRILASGSDLSHGMFSGARLTLGTWLASDGILGVEASGFGTQYRRDGVSFSSDSNGNPPLYIPIFLADFGSEGKFFISDPTVPFTGGVRITSTTQLWGVELNGFRNLVRQDGWSLDFLLGFRYLGLRDNIALQAVAANDPAADVQSFLSERFSTRNDFYGGQLGGRLEYNVGRLTLGFVAKVAIGSTHEVEDVVGATSLTGTGVQQVFGVAPGTFPGAIFAQSTNIGRQTGDAFTMAPQIQVKLGWDISSRVRALVAYDFLFWNNVIRPGDQIDRNINTAQSPLSPNFGNSVNPPVPAAMFNRTEFWAHGVSVGLEFHY